MSNNGDISQTENFVLREKKNQCGLLRAAYLIISLYLPDQTLGTAHRFARFFLFGRWIDTSMRDEAGVLLLLAITHCPERKKKTLFMMMMSLGSCELLLLL